MTGIPSSTQIQEVTSLVPVLTLSQGQRTSVLVAQDPKSNEEFVLKVGPYKNLKKEIELLESVKKHVNLIQLIKHFRVGEFLILQLEKAKGSSLTAHIMKTGALNCEQTLLILEQLVSVLEHLHTQGWIHRDLKPDNIVFDSETGSLKLIDFEFSGRWSKEKYLQESLGSYKYSAPEVRSGALYRGPEVDLWSLGVTLFVLLFLKFPFSKKELSTFSESSQLLNQNIKTLNCSSSSISSIIPSSSSSSSVSPSSRSHSNTIVSAPCGDLVPELWCSLLGSLLEVDSSKRLTLPQLKKQLKHLTKKQTQQKRRNTEFQMNKRVSVVVSKEEDEIETMNTTNLQATEGRKERKPFKTLVSSFFKGRKNVFSRTNKSQ